MRPLSNLASRRRDSRRRLTGLPRRPGRRYFPRPVLTSDERLAARCWRDTLADLGPIYGAIGCYLASRVDVLAPELCHQLASIPLTLVSSSPDLVRGRLRQELGSPMEACFRAFEDRPSESRWLYQTHSALLEDGTPVQVKLIRPELEMELSEDLADLELLGPGLASWAECRDRRPQVDDLLAQARAALEIELDLMEEAESYGVLSRKAPSELFIPHIYQELSTCRVLVTERSEHRTLNAIRAGAARPFGSVEGSHELAHRVILGWLRLALLGGRLPISPTAGQVGVTSDRRIVFFGGGFARLRASWQRQVRMYLESVMAVDPDTACSVLIDMMKTPPADDQDLRCRFRQLQPLPSLEETACLDPVVSDLLLHWRLCAELGLRLRSDQIVFYRSLRALARAAQQLAPQSTPWRTALEQISLEIELEQWRGRVQVHQIRQDFQSCIALLTQLPGSVETALSSLEGGLKVQLELPEATVQRRRIDSLSATVLLACVGLVLLLVERLAQLSKDGVWYDLLQAIFFLTLGGVLVSALRDR